MKIKNQWNVLIKIPTIDKKMIESNRGELENK